MTQDYDSERFDALIHAEAIETLRIYRTATNRLARAKYTGKVVTGGYNSNYPYARLRASIEDIFFDVMPFMKSSWSHVLFPDAVHEKMMKQMKEYDKESQWNKGTDFSSGSMLKRLNDLRKKNPKIRDKEIIACLEPPRVSQQFPYVDGLFITELLLDDELIKVAKLFKVTPAYILTGYKGGRSDGKEVKRSKRIHHSAL